MNANPPNQPPPPARPQKPPRLREARFQDHAQIAALVSRFGLHIESYPEWTHLWANNPAYRGLQDKFPIGWVLESSEGTIVGFLGNIPMEYELEGRKLLAATTRAWVVDTPYRTYSLLLLGTYFEQANVDLFLSTTVNSQSAEAYSTCKGVPVPLGAWDRTLFWITHYQGFIESYLHKLGVRPPAAQPLSYPGAAAVFLWDRLKNTHFQEKERAVEVLPCPAFDSRFDSFWAVLRERKNKLLLAVRNQEVLDWHFKFALQRGAAWIYTIEDASGLQAYAVFLRNDYSPIGLTRMRLVDFQCLNPERAADFLMAMLEAGVRRCRQESIHMLELYGVMPAFEQRIERAAPHRRTLPNWLYYYKARTPALAATLSQAAAWEPSLFDGDSSL